MMMMIMMMEESSGNCMEGLRKIRKTSVRIAGLRAEV
jgi:hypothetical protein